MESLEYGTVIWFNVKKGLGFIKWDKNGVAQKDMFVHYSDLAMEGFKVIYKDQKVSFKVGLNKHGQPKAVDVLVLKN